MHHPEPATRDDVAQAAAALLERLRARVAARALHHQRGGAEFHRQCAARGRLRALDDAVGRRDRRLRGRAPTRCLVNLGTFDRERREATAIAVETAIRGNLPWVLDPVFIDRSTARAAFARALIASVPKVVRLNRAEFTALAGSEPTRDALTAFARGTKSVIGLSGATDLVGDGERLAVIANGHPLMAKVTAMGCAVSALVAACLAVEAGRLARHRGGARHRRRRRRTGGREGHGSRQLRGRDPRCAVSISMGRR